MKLTLPQNRILKWALGVVGAILVGAIGSGVWQSVLGPALHAISRWLLDLASLGLTSYKTNVYRSIAADNQSVVSLIGFLSSTTVLILTMLVAAMHLLDWTDDESIKRTDPELTVTADALTKGFSADIGWVRLAPQVVVLLVPIILGGEVLTFVKLNYVNSADSHYHQVLRVVSPYLNDHERAMVESDFAQVGSREDYIKVLSRLEKLAKDNGRTVPQFDPW